MSSSPATTDRFGDQSALDQASIVDAALLLVDREGLGALTMRRLGRELGVEAMSLYHHVPNKAALVELVVDRALEPATVSLDSTSPLELVEEFSRHLRATVLEHPELASLAVPRLTSSSYVSEPTSLVLRQLIDAGFDEQAAAWIVSAFVRYVAGHALVELASPDDDAAFETGLRFLLGGLRDELGL